MAASNISFAPTSLFGYAPPASRAGGTRYARSVNDKALTLRVKALCQVLSNYVRDVAITGAIIEATNRLAIFNFAISQILPNKSLNGKLEKSLLRQTVY